MQQTAKLPEAANDFFATGVLAGRRCGNCVNWCRTNGRQTLGQCAFLPAGSRYMRFDVVCMVNNGNAFKDIR